MNSKWISVEKEPEINQWIFIYVGAKNPVMGCYKGGGKILDSSLNEIWNFTEDEIKFWQPLPLPPTEEPNSISNESIGEDVFKNNSLDSKIAREFTGHLFDSGCRINKQIIEKCLSIAKEYHQSKLEELERWIDTDCNWLQDSTIKSLKAKIKSL